MWNNFSKAMKKRKVCIMNKQIEVEMERKKKGLRNKTITVLK